MFLSSLIEELRTKEENDKTGCKLNFGHECRYNIFEKSFLLRNPIFKRETFVGWFQYNTHRNEQCLKH